MIIVQTPFRISFFGGGTDYPEHFVQHGGAVLGTAINRYAYISVSNFVSELFDYCIRISYRQVETVTSLDEIQHVPFRECLRSCGIERDIEVDYTAELPSFSGLGSSSSFVVCLLQALHAYKGEFVQGIKLAYEAIDLERRVLGESVGCQDQVFAAVGGLNVLEFRAEDDITVYRLHLPTARMRELEESLVMVFTGIRRRAENMAQRLVKRANDNLPVLMDMRRMVDRGYEILTGTGSLTAFGELLHEAWVQKQRLDEGVTSPAITELYELGRDAGAIGGKLLGAGGGGFILFFVPAEKRQRFGEKLRDFRRLSVRLNSPGSQVIHTS